MEQRYSLEDLEKEHAGAEIVICGNGPSAFNADLSGIGRPVWTINMGWIKHPESALSWMMDDLHGPALKVDSNNDRSFPEWRKWLQRIQDAPVPIMTSTAYPDFPALVEYPLQRVLRYFFARDGQKEITPYFNETINYMIAWAVMVGVKRIDFIGIDYINVRPDERASSEFWAGRAAEHGVKLGTSDLSHFLKPQDMDGINRHIPGLYGYLPQNMPLTYQVKANGSVRIQV